MRVSDRMASRQALRSINKSQSRLARIQLKVGTQKALTRPSDNAAGTERAIRLRARLSTIVQQQANVDDASTRLEVLDASLKSVQGILGRLNELAQIGLSGTNSADDFKVFGAEANLLAEDLFKEANAQNDGHYVFSGDTPWKPPFSRPLGVVQYDGNPVPLEIQVDSGTKVKVGLNGGDLFQVGTPDDVFEMASKLAAALSTGDVDEIRFQWQLGQAAENRVITARSTAGVAAANLVSESGIANRISEEVIKLKDSIGKIEEADFEEAATELVSQEAAYQAALAVSARIAQRRSLVDYLK